MTAAIPAPRELVRERHVNDAADVVLGLVPERVDVRLAVAAGGRRSLVQAPPRAPCVAGAPAVEEGVVDLRVHSHLIGVYLPRLESARTTSPPQPAMSASSRSAPSTPRS